MSTAPDRSVAEVAARHHGLFTIAHLRTLGFSRGQVDQRLRSGRWQQLHRGVYGSAGAPRSWEAKVLSECWGVRGLAVASHRSAAQLWELPGGRKDVVEITCRRGRRSSRGGLVVHEADSGGASGGKVAPCFWRGECVMVTDSQRQNARSG